MFVAGVPGRLDDQALPSARAVCRRAHGRGEIDLERTPSAVFAMPFDLVRHDIHMDLEPVPAARIRSIVDDLFLPLLGEHGTATAAVISPLTARPPARQSVIEARNVYLSPR
ncbi:hypothetical protein Abr02nite_48560 [Paractinoplanes brasiliensis]|nr:hypothetical protein Abr02nite_48560 [Actinoplanes brasiliensis]